MNCVLLYFSPETVINGVQKPPAEIWAFGCIVFEMLTGKQLWLAYKKKKCVTYLMDFCGI